MDFCHTPPIILSCSLGIQGVALINEESSYSNPARHLDKWILISPLERKSFPRGKFEMDVEAFSIRMNQ